MANRPRPTGRWSRRIAAGATRASTGNRSAVVTEAGRRRSAAGGVYSDDHRPQPVPGREVLRPRGAPAQTAKASLSSRRRASGRSATARRAATGAVGARRRTPSQKAQDWLFRNFKQEVERCSLLAARVGMSTRNFAAAVHGRRRARRRLATFTALRKRRRSTRVRLTKDKGCEDRGSRHRAIDTPDTRSLENNLPPRSPFLTSGRRAPRLEGISVNPDLPQANRTLVLSRWIRGNQ